MSLIVIQPTSGCNINCKYCYVPNRRNFEVMDLSAIRGLVKSINESSIGTLDQNIEFLWHCGEPLIAGLDFFKSAFDILEGLDSQRHQVSHSIQTNAILINDSWCEFLKNNHVNVGVSIDGPKHLHDHSRVNWANRGTFEQVMKGIDCLRENGMNPGALCVITDQHLNFPEEIIDFFVENEFPSVGFNIEEVDNAHTQSSLMTDKNVFRPEALKAFRTFLSLAFDKWLEVHDRLEIREFYDFVNVVQLRLENKNYVRLPHEVTERGIFTIQRNGDTSTYSPEFAGSNSEQFENFVIGNVLRETFEKMCQSSNFCKIRSEISARQKKCQIDCYLYSLCGGSFASNAYFENGNFENTKTGSCKMLRHEVADVVFDRLSLNSELSQSISDSSSSPQTIP